MAGYDRHFMVLNIRGEVLLGYDGQRWFTERDAESLASEKAKDGATVYVYRQVAKYTPGEPVREAR